MTSTENIIFRTEQQEAIDFTVDTLQRSRKVLWNAKMRFGKTLCALEVAHRIGYRRTLVLTHRPAVRQEWFDSIEKLGLASWTYGSKTNGSMTEAERKRRGASFDELESNAAKDKSLHYVYFASMQDLRGSKRVNQQKGIAKNDDIFTAKWDFLIVDEAHEGISTRLGNDVIAELQKRRQLRTLYLSGTPYNIQQSFDTNDVYHWDYCMEQRAKEDWDAAGYLAPNPYACMARMNILSYNLHRDFAKYHFADSEGFCFAEFFRTDDTTMRFVHEDDVRKFVSMLATSPRFPFADAEISDTLRHTLWYVPGVSAARCLADILAEDSESNPFRGYAIVNVAGDNVASDVLQHVKEAINANERTITLSCGRLTTGVSVPEWTGVVMLAGAAETGGARYFQTIFRCQSPFKGEAIKKECYAFDFSPMRTLAVIDQYINNNLASDKQTDRFEKIAEFLHFCPTTVIDGAKRTTIDTETFIREINSSYSTSLIRNGFRNDCLYSNLNNLGKQDLRLLDEVAEAMFRGIIEERKQNRETIQGEQKSSKRTRNSAEKEAKDEEKIKQQIAEQREVAHRMTPRQRAIAILSQISTRFPIMIYGTVDNIEGLTIDSFLRNIDAESWRDFMPKGITMQLFKRLKHFYREDIFVATAKAIVERLHHADTLPTAERVAEIADILSDFCYPDRETVLTPWRVVNRHMADTFGGYCFFNDDFTKPIREPRFVYHEGVTNRTLMNPKARVLDICSKTGLYSLYTAYSMYKLQSSESQGLFDMLSDEESGSMWQEIIENNIFAVCKTRMAESITRRTLVGFRRDVRVNVQHIDGMNSQVIVYKRKFINTITDARNFWNVFVKPNEQSETCFGSAVARKRGLKSNIKTQQMKFDAIIGNPPYQMNIGEKKDNYGIPLYNEFMEIAREMKPQYISMIMPSRWFTGGRGLDNFRQTMLSDKHIRAIFDFIDSKDCFPTVDISGGIGYFLWDAKHKSECEFTNYMGGKSSTRSRRLNEFPIFVRNNNALSLIYKVKKKSKKMLNTQVSGQTPFGFVSTFRGTAEPTDDGQTVMLKSSGATTYVQRSEIKKNAQWIDLYKVIFSKATCEHAGTPDRNGQFRVLSAAAILAPACVCTQSYLVGGTYATEAEANNLLTYLKTKFARYLMLQTITSQDLSPEKFMFVPIQNFTAQSDINWDAPLADIDRQLYAKYNVEEAEIALIENTIKEM